MNVRFSPSSVRPGNQDKASRSIGDRVDKLSMLNTAIEIFRNVWDTFLGKVAILSLSVGWMPIVLMNYVREALAR